jgi:hypothetical protein
LGTKYSSQATSGYNSSPPVDDGTASEANKVKWSTIKTKLADVLKTFGEAINTALVTAFDQSCRTVTASDSAAATDHNRTIQVTTSSVTITLADATTMAAGYIVSVANQSAGDITVALATSTDTIDTVTNTTQTISAKEVRRYIVNTAATGYITASDRVVAASDTIAGKLEIATQAEQETGTDVVRAVTPGRQQFHQSANKGWVRFANNGTINASYNVDSITDTNPGDWTVTWTTDFSTANYQADVTPTGTEGSYVTGHDTPAAGTLRVWCTNGSTGVLADPNVGISVSARGDQ